MFKRPFELVERLRIPMGPRKKSKPNSSEGEGQGKPNSTTPAAASTSTPQPKADLPAGDTQSVNVPVAPTLRDVGASQVSQSTPQLATSSSANSNVQRQVDHRASWYGSWRGAGKAKPLAEVAKDNVPASPTGVTSSSSLPQSDRRASNATATTATPTNANAVPPSPRRYMSGSIRKASKSQVVPASTSNLSVVSDSTKKVTEQAPSAVAAVEEPPKEAVPEPPLPPDPAAKPKEEGQVPAQAKSGQQSAGGSWFGWWSRPDGYVEKKEGEVEDAKSKPLPESPAEERAQPKLDQATFKQTPTVEPPKQAPTEQDTKQEPTANTVMNTVTQRSSWFWSWSTQQNEQGNERPPTANDAKSQANVEVAAATKLPEDTAMSDAPAAKPIEPIPPKAPETALPKLDAKPSTKGQPTPPRKSTGWAFWSREEPDDNESGKTHKQVGEIAVEGTPSQNNPEAAQFNENEERDQPSKEPAKSKAKSLRGRPSSKDSPKDSPKQPSTPAKATPSGSPDRSKPSEPKVAALAGKPSKEQPKQAKESTSTTKEDKNLLLPSFNSTYSLLQQPTLWSQLRRLFIADTQALPTPHLHLTPNPPRIKKALAIGIHGFFPSPIYQRILGPPTGTSIRFSNCAAHAIKSWAETHGQSDVQIEKIALEGEGLIAERVDTLWKLLLNWIDHIRSADFILVACHSQGVPVAVMLVAKLIAFGCINPNMRVGVCAMAGISLGPFAEYKTRLFGTTGLELFEFAEPESRVSKEYRGALEEVLGAGVRIVYVGSIDDQLVSLESSIFAPASHPNIYRAVFIDGRLHTSDFLTALIGFTLKLRNLGLPDHGLIRELSPALAGSLYTGEGHSNLHSYAPIYDLAVRHTLETVADTSVAGMVGEAKVGWGTLQGPPSVKDANPFFLPWAMRGILEEESVRRLMGGEVEELLRLFEEWRPVSKGLRDVKFRLEAVRSKSKL